METTIDITTSMVTSAPMILVKSMPQRSEVRTADEDWTGKSSTAERRKLQNRLNKRASRRRLHKGPQDSSKVGIDSDFKRDLLFNLTSYTAHDNTLANSKEPIIFCLNSTTQNAIISAPNFSSYFRAPLPVDQKLLPLLQFNLVRALTTNIFLLGLTPDQMDLDIESPFTLALKGSSQTSFSLDKLPPTLHPTRLQSTVHHHPEVDIFPFPAFRDNMILAGPNVFDDEICIDILYGVQISESVEITSRSCLDGPFSDSGRTGLIVWDDPWKPESWEVDERFANKYKGLLRGCDYLLRSSNYWRSVRGEPPLVLEEV